jgi:hypothetical protein
MKTYGMVGVSVYGSATAVSITSIYLVLRMGGAEYMTAPLEAVLGKDSDVVQNLKHQLGEASAGAVKEGDANNNKSSSREINFVREGTYLGIASIVDSLVLPLKLVICLPVAKYILKRRGGR